MNEPHEPNHEAEFNAELLHRVFSKAIPYVITGVVSLVTFGGAYFFGTVWDIVTRLDRECPGVHADISGLKGSLGEVRGLLAEFPRPYEVRSAIEKSIAASEYKGSDSVAMVELQRRVDEIRGEVRENRARILVPYMTYPGQPPQQQQYKSDSP